MNSVCTHFGTCGGCSLQGLSSEEYRQRKQDGVCAALVRANLSEVEVEGPFVVAEHSRRRAVFKFGKEKGRIVIGFHAAKSHAIVDMRECRVLTPALFGLAQRLRDGLVAIQSDGEKGEVHVTETETGFDLAFRSPRKLAPALTAALAKAFSGAGVARIVFNGEMLFGQAAPAVRFGEAVVALPPHAFLQATVSGEAVLAERVQAALEGAKTVADLFAGLGTFTLPLARRARVHAVEQDAQALAALADGARKTKGLKPVTTETRDLFKIPLTPLELNRFDAVVLDPPRAGAEAQIRSVAGSKLKRVAYVSCDAGSFARDAAILVKAGFRAGSVLPVDQFLYSDHIELVGSFTR
ncbi:MAG TPA: RsmD family RNA methyltransferase [Rhizomicrobium sp.]|jgi:23S rRNA (uracil1939-C5)-methyltransferase